MPPKLAFENAGPVVYSCTLASAGGLPSRSAGPGSQKKHAEVRMQFDPSTPETLASRQTLTRQKLAVFVLLAGFGFLTPCARGQAARPAAPQEQVTVIRAGTLIDGKGGPPRANQVILIRCNRIEQVQDAAAAGIPAGAKVIDL